MSYDNLFKDLRVHVGDRTYRLDEAPASGSLRVTYGDKNYNIISDDSTTPPPPPPSEKFDWSKVKWCDTTISHWPITSVLKASHEGNRIVLDYDKRNTWHPINKFGSQLNANAWVVFVHNGKWIASTFEWMRPGQYKKSARAVHGDHIKHSFVPRNWKPSNGQELGFFVSTIIRRGAFGNGTERTNISWIKW